MRSDAQHVSANTGARRLEERHIPVQKDLSYWSDIYLLVGQNICLESPIINIWWCMEMAYIGNLLMARFDFSMDSNFSINCANESFLFTYLACDCWIMKAIKKEEKHESNSPTAPSFWRGPSCFKGWSQKTMDQMFCAIGPQLVTSVLSWTIKNDCLPAAVGPKKMLTGLDGLKQSLDTPIYGIEPYRLLQYRFTKNNIDRKKLVS